MKNEIENSKGQFLVYNAEDGTVKIDVKLSDESVWLTQQLMAELFQTTKQNISLHVNNIYKEQELFPKTTVKEYLTVRKEGSREVKRRLEYYNLDMIISVGFRISELLNGDFIKKITDIYATSVDYDPTLNISINFFKTVQNKMHWAITGNTAAEIIHSRADAEKPDMGLTNYRGVKVQKKDILCAACWKKKCRVYMVFMYVKTRQVQAYSQM